MSGEVEIAHNSRSKTAKRMTGGGSKTTKKKNGSKSKYQKFLSNEISRQHKLHPGKDNTEYMKLAAKAWAKYKVEHGIVTGSKSAKKKMTGGVRKKKKTNNGSKSASKKMVGGAKKRKAVGSKTAKKKKAAGSKIAKKKKAAGSKTAKKKKSKSKASKKSARTINSYWIMHVV